MNAVPLSEFRKRSNARAKRMFDDFDRKRRGILTEVAREFYPLGVPGLAKGVDDLSDECVYDHSHRLYTTKPVDALRRGAAGFHGNLTSPARRWFIMRRPSFAYDGQEIEGETLDKLTEAVEWAMKRGNVYSSVYKLYEHCLAFGFGCMLICGDAERIVKACTLRVGTYAMDVDGYGDVCRIARKFSFTPEQISTTFPTDAIPDRVRELVGRDGERQRFTVVSIIERAEANDRMQQALFIPEDLPWRETYWLESAKDDDPFGGILRATGYAIKPFVAPRMDVEPGDVYGRGRGIDALDVARGAQSMQHDIYANSHQRTNPALIVSSEFKTRGFRAGAGQINYAQPGGQMSSMAAPVLPHPPSSDETRVDRQECQDEIEDLFFNSSFATIDALKNNPGVKTATEVDALVRENMERLNPVITNFDKELLDPLVSVVAHYVIASGVFPLTPEDVSSLATVNAEYVSQIHIAAKRSRISAIDELLAKVGSIAQVAPQALDRIDTDNAVGLYRDLLGAPASCLRDERQVQAIREERARAAESQRMVEETERAASAAKNLGAMPTDDAHAGSYILKGMGA